MNRTEWQYEECESSQIDENLIKFTDSVYERLDDLVDLIPDSSILNGFFRDSLITVSQLPPYQSTPAPSPVPTRNTNTANKTQLKKLEYRLLKY